MNNTVELVRLWGEFEKYNPNGSIEDFCRERIASKTKETTDTSTSVKLAPDINGRLTKLIGRIAKYQNLYMNKALTNTGLMQIEEFGLLATIYNLDNPKKSEVISDNLMEISSGANMLIRLKDRKLILEHADTIDKRAKKIKLTAKGEKVLMEAKSQILKVVKFLLQDLNDTEKLTCITLLTRVNESLSSKFHKHKNQDFDFIFSEYLENIRSAENK